MLTQNTDRKLAISQLRFFLACLITLMTVGIAAAQTPSPSPKDETVDDKVGSFTVRSSIEVGYRGRSVDGSENKFRSDWNYKSGVRVFNSSFNLEDKEGKNPFFDTLTVNSSGWGADPSGHVRVDVEKTGAYRFNTNVRQVKYFNFLNNHALGQHGQNTRNNMGDFDLTVFPESDRFKFTLGYSFGRHTGPGFSTARSYRDDFMTGMNTRIKSDDLRAGVQAKLGGFRLSFTQGYRYFRDRSHWELSAPSVGNNPTDTTIYNTFVRDLPTRGYSHFSVFDVTRTFAKRLDFTGRFIYSSTSTDSTFTDRFTGRDNSNNFIDMDLLEVYSRAKRPQKRADLGLTFRATDKFTLSNTFSYDTFTVNGGENLTQNVNLRNSAGVAQPQRLSTSMAYRVNDFERYSNLAEADYQFSTRLGVHVGYRYTHRKVAVNGFDRNFISNNVASTVNNPTAQCPYTGTGTANPLIFCEAEKNSTNTFLAGMKVKPFRHWVLFWDIEKGEADNVFTRIENYEFTNFRVRNRFTFNKLAVSLSAITKNNTNPAETDNIPPQGFGPVVKSRIYAGSMDWTPMSELIISGGYTYTHQTAKTPIYVRRSFPPSTTTVSVLGRSEYYVRDHDFYIDVAANPFRRLSLYAAYRFNKDNGQGDIPLTDPYPVLIGSSPTAALNNPELIILSYPMRMTSPEVRMSLRLSRRLDWNVGYQYLNYKERFQTLQDYKAHLPYTSLTLYIGGRELVR